MDQNESKDSKPRTKLSIKTKENLKCDVDDNHENIVVFLLIKSEVVRLSEV